MNPVAFTWHSTTVYYGIYDCPDIRAEHPVRLPTDVEWAAMQHHLAAQEQDPSMPPFFSNCTLPYFVTGA